MICAMPDCVIASTVTVPNGVVQGCSATPTVTSERVCKGYCHGECGVNVVTETASMW